MENQHRKIKGYRELSQAEVNLMNELKQHEKQGLRLAQEVENVILRAKREAREKGDTAEGVRLEKAEPERWLAIGRTDLQTSTMALVRAVAQPGS